MTTFQPHNPADDIQSDDDAIYMLGLAVDSGNEVLLARTKAAVAEARARMAAENKQ